MYVCIIFRSLKILKVKFLRMCKFVLNCAEIFDVKFGKVLLNDLRCIICILYFILFCIVYVGVV